MKTVHVSTPSRSYTVHVGEEIIQKAANLLDPGDAETIVLLTDRRVGAAWADVTRKALAEVTRVVLLEMNPGESNKTFAMAGNLLRRLARRGIRRHDLMVTLGGGVVSDLGGFVASIYQRGMAVAHIPTTLVAQVDAAIGGKTGVNLPQGKNLMGTFYQPKAVIADVATLKTLPDREFTSGLAEVIKYGFTLDPALLSRIEDSEALLSRDSKTLEDVVGRCVELKAQVIAEDERDESTRAVLNYGHTLGHALEAHGGYGRWLHGEAISVGMVFAAELSKRLGLIAGDVVDEHRKLLQIYRLPVEAAFDPEEIVNRWNMDKKNLRGQRWVLLTGLGKWKLQGDVDRADIQNSLEEVLPR